jgi:hypothetical protein
MHNGMKNKEAFEAIRTPRTVPSALLPDYIRKTRQPSAKERFEEMREAANDEYQSLINNNNNEKSNFLGTETR